VGAETACEQKETIRYLSMWKEKVLKGELIDIKSIHNNLVNFVYYPIPITKIACDHHVSR
jgi:hypothetical protein